MEWHQKTVEDALAALQSGPQDGLDEPEAARRLARYGPNALADAPRDACIVRFARQFTEFIVLVLVGAATVAGALGEWVDALSILAIVLMNGVIGFWQDEKAGAVMEALKRLAAPLAKAVRGGQTAVIPGSGLVPGDIIVLEAGDAVPADCRVIESRSLRIDESSLTGESNAVDKGPGPLAGPLPLADRTNMAYMSTHAVHGRGRAVVVATGMSTEMGRLAALIQAAKPEPTPLQRRITEFGRLLVYAAGGICALIFALGVARGESVMEMFLTAVSLAVAAIPEGLPAVVTITLALGVQRMSARHVLVRKLPSVETLGSASIIASDKTGTLTRNEMIVKKIYAPRSGLIAVTGAGYASAGAFYEGTDEADPRRNPGLVSLLRAGVLSSTAELREGHNGGWTVIGDPTEGALLAVAMKAGIKREDALAGLELVGEAPFDSSRKMMTVAFKDGAGYVSFTKGAPELVLAACRDIPEGGSARPMTGEERRRVIKASEEMSAAGLRVLAVAGGSSNAPFDSRDLRPLEAGLVFLGLIGMADPPREEVYAAVAKARAAGITPLMITGDHKITAVAIAKELGIFMDGDMAVTGAELDGMNEAALEARLSRIKVYARVAPEHKLRIVKAWRHRGEIIAMTGDGVNDAPALREADIGIAMGMAGTDVTREASDMVLTDDNFASIVSAVEEGRGIFSNIRKVAHFLLSCNAGEILVLLAASLAGLPLPLLPAQILWTNLVTDGLPALGLAMEAAAPGIMDAPPRPRGEGILTRPMMAAMLAQGALIAAFTLAVYGAELYWLGSPVVKARTMAFAVIVFSQMFHVYNCRSLTGTALTSGLFKNRTLNWAVAAILAGQFLIIHVPWFAAVFKTVPLGPYDWAIVFAASVQPVVWMEVVKAVRRGRKAGNS
ncbi:MAG: cation-translocating P-type ATPase [Deltaproteobacteria bacterium]|nr:cation-translocating P-type ATPase [Deltaproteobacteria bacterium]